MNLDEYYLYAQGYIEREALRQQPYRKLWQLIWNVNAGKGDKIRTEEQLRRYWPLPGQKSANELRSREYIINTFRQQLEASRIAGTCNN